MCIRITRIYYQSVTLRKTKKENPPKKVCNKNKCLSFVYIKEGGNFLAGKVAYYFVLSLSLLGENPLQAPGVVHQN